MFYISLIGSEGVNMKEVIYKNKSNDYILNQIEDSYVILDKKTKSLHLLNESAVYMLENCDGKTADEIAHEIYDNCLNKDEITEKMIKEDCSAIMMEMEKRGWIVYGERKN